MSKTSTYPLRLPKSLRDEVAGVAKRDGTSINQFIAIAAAEKVSALKTESFSSSRS
jgi:predicted HicB family RNase H-like nuclease